MADNLGIFLARKLPTPKNTFRRVSSGIGLGKSQRHKPTLLQWTQRVKPLIRRGRLFFHFKKIQKVYIKNQQSKKEQIKNIRGSYLKKNTKKESFVLERWDLWLAECRWIKLFLLFVDNFNCDWVEGVMRGGGTWGGNKTGAGRRDRLRGRKRVKVGRR